jgi:hypothetical protein
LPFSDKKLFRVIRNKTEQTSKRKTSEFRSEPFLGREKPWEFHSKPFLDEKNLGIPFQTIFGRESYNLHPIKLQPSPN